MWTEICPQEDGFTFESEDPRMRIDYAWAGPGLIEHLESNHAVGNRVSPNGERISHHLGLLVALKDR